MQRLLVCSIFSFQHVKKKIFVYGVTFVIKKLTCILEVIFRFPVKTQKYSVENKWIISHEKFSIFVSCCSFRRNTVHNFISMYLWLWDKMEKDENLIIRFVSWKWLSFLCSCITLTRIGVRFNEFLWCSFSSPAFVIFLFFSRLVYSLFRFFFAPLLTP